MLIFLCVFALVPVLLPLFAKRMGAKVFLLAALLPAAAFVYTAIQYPQIALGKIPYESYNWIPALNIEISMRMATLNWVMALIVTGVGALVMIYCAWYFQGKSGGLGLFSAVLLGFSGAMYGLVLTDNLVILVMFWEITSILSYLLIGFYHRRSASRRAALQALLVTTLGGLVMLIGVVLLVVYTGTTSISAILLAAPTGAMVNAALILILVGALSKSAIFPFQFWLPGAMAAPTPVSAYLHAAAMVKAGIYLIALFAPFFAENPVWRPIVISLGVFTLLLGGFQALREYDLKRILAFGTVSQLGMLAVVLGFGVRDTAMAGMALLISHALFKSALFLIVGVIDRQLGTRDIRELSGLGRQAPVMATAAFVAVASMAGVIPTLGFVAKEGVLDAFMHEAFQGQPWAIVAFVGIVIGSIFTMAYGARFIWGAFWRKANTEQTQWPDPPIGFLASPVILSALTLVIAFAAPMLDRILDPYAELAPTASVNITPPEYAYHLALWHGFNPAFWVSTATLVLGLLLFGFARKIRWAERGRFLPFTGTDAYNLVVRSVGRASVEVTAITQRGSLPVYVGIIFIVFIAAEASVLLSSSQWQADLVLWQSPAQLLIAPIMIAAGIMAVFVRKRYTGVVLVSVTGLGMVVLFSISGAPDLALTQILVETVTLVVFALVLRRIPAHIGTHNDSVRPVLRGLLAAAVALIMVLIAIVATGVRQAIPVSVDWANFSYEIGHGKNIVNVALVDLRGWDTMGELSVLVLAATGVASLVFVTHRRDTLSQLSALPQASRRVRRSPLVETSDGLKSRNQKGVNGHTAWLVGGEKLKASSRSLMLEVLVRILFHSIMIISLYLLFAGHNLPGGGFAGGLVAGMALVMRYIAGGRYELGAASPTDAGRFLGGGLALAVTAAIVPIFFGQAPLQSTTFSWDMPLLGHLEFVTSTIFDVGVYLVVVGLVLDVLRSLGAEVDRQLKEEHPAEVSR